MFFLRIAHPLFLVIDELVNERVVFFFFFSEKKKDEQRGEFVRWSDGGERVLRVTGVRSAIREG